MLHACLLPLLPHVQQLRLQLQQLLVNMRRLLLLLLLCTDMMLLLLVLSRLMWLLILLGLLCSMGHKHHWLLQATHQEPPTLHRHPLVAHR
jgi:hypothetical protein